MNELEKNLILLFSQKDFEENRGIMIKILNETPKKGILAAVRGISPEHVLAGLTELDQLEKMEFLISLTKAEDESISKKALKLLEKEFLKIDDVSDPIRRVRIAKFLAVHSKTKVSKEAMKKIVVLLPEILSSKNIEFKAAILRFLIVNGYEDTKLKLMQRLRQLPDDDLKEFSLNYIRRMKKSD